MDTIDSIIQLTLCENVHSTENSTVIENPFTHISFPFMPTTVSFRVAATIGLINYSGEEKIDMRLQMYKKETPKDVVFDSNPQVIGPIQPPPSGGTLENINLDFSLNNIAIREVGIYVIKLTFDNNTKEQEVYIRRDDNHE